MDIDEPKCNTLKENQYSLKFKRTAGVCASVASNGIILALCELYGAESKTQVYLFFLTLLAGFVAAGKHIPGYLLYDDGCHLFHFRERRKDRNESLCKLFNDVIIAIDRLHFKNHVDTWCKKHMNPNKYPDLDGVNTQTSEQTFSWLKKFKGSVNYMNESHFLLFILRMCHLRNKRNMLKVKKK
eukprot:Lithocolla_globosa_v1_NODE_2703_length_1899_cov_64.991866.p1 type:complete len:184 gc:universal NODE_2703_length_1899_cov_64.991866:987-436(-)